MAFIMKILLISIVTLNLACASTVGRQFFGPGLGDNPFERLQDFDELSNESALNRLLQQSNVPPSNNMDNLQKKTLLRTFAPMCPSSVLLFRGREDINFILYNKNVPHGETITGDEDEEENKLIPNAPIKLIIHGFLNSANSMIIQDIKNAYMSRDEDYNIIGVDWTKGSGTWMSNYFNCLITSRIVPLVGAGVAEFIVDLVEKQNVNILHVSVIGHSLGAQIAGRAGKKLIQLGYKLPVIVGLDPALPSFVYNDVTERLAATDAEYVEVIHTNPGELGYDIPIGTADFYVNYGLIKNNRQPMCVTPACSHAMSFKFYAESVRNPTAFEAKKCGSFELLERNRCRISNNDQDVTVYMGGNDLRQGKQAGVFFLRTNKNSPFGMN